jgi:hypothetical protein
MGLDVEMLSDPAFWLLALPIGILMWTCAVGSVVFVYKLAKGRL